MFLCIDGDLPVPYDASHCVTVVVIRHMHAPSIKKANYTANGYARLHRFYAHSVAIPGGHVDPGLPFDDLNQLDLEMDQLAVREYVRIYIDGGA